MRFGEQVRSRRKAKGLTQKQLAGLAGISQENISRIEKHRDVDTVYLGTAIRIARVLCLTVDELIGNTPTAAESAAAEADPASP